MRQVTFVTQPPGARVFLEVSGNRGGDYLGLSGQPLHLDLACFKGASSVDVRFERDGYRPEVRTLRSLYLDTFQVFPEQGAIVLQPTHWQPPWLWLGLGAAAVVWAGAQARRRTRLEVRLNQARGRLLAQERELRTRTRELEEAGRLALAHELHDGLMQYLVAAELHLENVRDELGDHHDLGRALHGLREATQEGRRLLRQTGPALLERGLAEALEELCAELERDGRVVQRSVRLPDDVPEESRLTVYRIVQEALNNVRKHAGREATVEVDVVGQIGGVRLSVADDGAGFDTATPQAGVGLESMRSRACGLAGGRLTITSEPGQGTRVEAWVPTCASDPDAG